MKFNWYIVALSLPLLIACNKENENATPECVTEQLAVFDGTQACEGATVKRYDFQGSDVYLFDPGNCPQADSIEVRSSECQVLGYLGGILNNTFINGVEFSSHSEFKALVWAAQ